MNRLNKSFRLDLSVVKMLREMSKDLNVSETAFIEWAIRNVNKSFEYQRHTPNTSAGMQKAKETSKTDNENEVMKQV